MSVVAILAGGLWSLGASAGCAVYFNAARKDAVLGAVLGSAGWMAYLASKSGGGNEVFAYFLGAFVVAACSEFLAVVMKRPATVYLVPGIIPLVPGGGIFLMMRAFVQGAFPEALAAGYDTLAAAVAIALGVAIASSLSRIVMLVRKGRESRRIRKAEQRAGLPDDVDS